MTCPLKNGTMWPERHEWEAAAEHYVRTMCDPRERVSRDVGRWLSYEETSDLHEQLYLVVKDTRCVLNRAARQAGPGPAPVDVRVDRTLLSSGLRQTRRPYADVDDVLLGANSVMVVATRRLGKDNTELVRLTHQTQQLRTRRDTAAQAAVEEAVRREIARRATEEGWQTELSRRACIDAADRTRLGLR
ncbi:hypothetical protein [Nocardiopsis synnemataformans]|uniref:hypothetical protein n=1 Tax=Nocardiopsis synnemataformans TaxID=61305 RepID=UPI003EB787C5